jgi:hypothetical protein
VEATGKGELTRRTNCRLIDEMHCQDWDEHTPLAESLQNLKIRHAQTPLSTEERLNAARMCNSIHALATRSLQVTFENIMSVFARSIDFQFDPKVSLLLDKCATQYRG